MNLPTCPLRSLFLSVFLCVWAAAANVAIGEPAEQPSAADETSQTNSPGEQLWSLQPIGDPQPPAVEKSAWPRNAIDRFILAKLEANGLRPVRDAQPPTLLRRIYFDLIGLPPSPQTVREFTGNYSPRTYAALVDRLLASPQFGERWGRHWLDVARYAESNGKSRDVLMPHAWRYRDYVIDAFNADRPFDQFLTEQIAGDLLSAETPQERDRQRIATGFLAIGAKTLVGPTKQDDLIDEQINAMGKAMLGMTIGCARCHDHKFDPIPTKDYYALSGIFRSTETLFGGGLNAPKQPAGKSRELLVLGRNARQQAHKVRQRRQRIQQLTKDQKAAKKRLKKQKQQLQKLLQKPTRARKPDEAESSARQKQRDQVQKTQDELAALKRNLKAAKQQPVPQLEFGIGVREAEKIRNSRLHIGGGHNRLAEEVPRGFLSCLSFPDGPEIEKKRSGRLALARWVTHPQNPLTARVAVNRIWQHLFGRGLVPTVDNFGRTGQPPSHPKLLDHLAGWFMEHDWSVKEMIREIVLSRTYRLSGQYNEANYSVDPAGTLLWRMPRRRLEAEAIRDAMLAASGRLNRQRPDASAVAEIGDGEVGRGISRKPLRNPFPHRSVYLPIIRTIIPEILKTFDFPEPSNVQGRRAETNVPAQSLFLMNDPFVIQQAEMLAERVMAEHADNSRRVALTYNLCFGRFPNNSETAEAVHYLRRQQQQMAGDDNADEAARAAWTAFCQALFASAEFRYIE